MADGSSTRETAMATISTRDVASKVIAAQLKAREAEAILHLLGYQICAEVDDADLPGGYLACSVALQAAREAAEILDEITSPLCKGEVTCG